MGPDRRDLSQTRPDRHCDDPWWRQPFRRGAVQQPYALYVPQKPVPVKGFGLVVSMHGLSANYNEFLGSHEAEEMGERGSGLDLRLPRGARARRQLPELRRG